jgi:hypothetical protein
MSRKQTLALAGVAILLALTAVSCEKWCRDNDFHLAGECPPPVEPPPGPPIILEPDPGTGAMGWRIDGNPAADGGTVFPDCELRYNAIGIGIVDFNVYTAGSSTPLSAKHVVIENGDYKIEILRSYLNTFVWKVYDQRSIPDPQLPCAGVAPGEAMGDELPTELLDVLNPVGGVDATITEEHHGVDVEKLEIRVKLP